MNIFPSRVVLSVTIHVAARYSRFGAAPVMSIAYLRHLAPERVCVPDSRCA